MSEERAPENSPDELAARAAGVDDQVLNLAAGLYRDEMKRVVTWRDRLDRTTNWAVVLAASVLTWTFSSLDHPHYILLVAEAAIVALLVVEARRYRVYDVWRSRIRMLEENVFANAFDPEGAQQPEWRELLSRDLRDPCFKVPWHEALQRRLRRIYLGLFLLLGIAWSLRVAVLPREPELLAAAAIGKIPGLAVIVIVAIAHILLVVATAWPLARSAKGSLGPASRSSSAWDG